MFAVKIVRLIVLHTRCQSSRSQLRLKLDTFLTYTLTVISRTIIIEAMAFKLGMTVDLCKANYARAHFDDLDLDARSQ